MPEININGSGTLAQDLAAFKIELTKRSAAAMDEVGADMQSALAKHIETDVYAAYSPKLYERRGMDGGLVAQAMTAKIYNHGAGVSIEYKPDGMHPKVPGWNKVHGDDLIGRIEKHSPEYNWLPKNKTIPNRPFWQNFVSEMVDDGTAEYYYAAAMRRQGEDVTEDGAIVREANDGAY